MYDPWRPHHSDVTSMNEMVHIDAFDLTDVDSAYDYHYGYDDPYHAYPSYSTESMSRIQPPPSSSESRSSYNNHNNHNYYWDLTHFGAPTNTYSTNTYDDYSAYTPRSGISSHLNLQPHQIQTPQPYDSYQDIDLNTPASPSPIPTFQKFRELRTPTPPTPIPKFKVFDLTCFIEDRPALNTPNTPNNANKYYSYTPKASPANAWKQSHNSPDMVIPEPTPMSPPYQTSYLQPASPHHHTNDPQPEDTNTVAIQAIRESAVVVHPQPNQHSNTHSLEEHSTIDVTDYSTFTPNQSSEVTPNSIDMFAADCIRPSAAVDTCDDHLFDQLCRGLKPADTGTIAPSVTKLDREEIMSCGTLPPEKYKHQPKTSTKNRTKRNGQKRSTKKNNRNKPNNYQELPAVESPDCYHYYSRQRHRSSYDRSDSVSKGTTTILEDEFLLRYDGKYRDKNCSQTEAGPGPGPRRLHRCGDEPTVSTVDTSVDNSIYSRREWMGNFIQELFDEDQTKAIYYASSIAQESLARGRGEPPKRRGQLVGDFEKIKQYIGFVLGNLDLADVLDNIDAGKYDDNLGDFQEDIELALEESMEKYEIFLEHEKRKWNSKFLDNDTNRARLQELRDLAGEELMKQLDTDFRMQLLDHFCHQISKQQQVEKRRERRRMRASRRAMVA